MYTVAGSFYRCRGLAGVKPDMRQTSKSNLIFPLTYAFHNGSNFIVKNVIHKSDNLI